MPQYINKTDPKLLSEHLFVKLVNLTGFVFCFFFLEKMIQVGPLKFRTMSLRSATNMEELFTFMLTKTLLK